MNIDNKTIMGLVLNDFVDTYMVQSNTHNRDIAIDTLNSGYCGVVAMCVGNVLRERYGITTVDWASHCLHMWLVLDGVHYDTIYPEGYPDGKDPAEVWLLKEQHYNSEIMYNDDGIGLEDNDGYVQCHVMKCLYLIKGWYERYDMTPPMYLKSMFARHRKHKGGKREARREERRYKLMLAKPLPKEGDVVRTNTVLPMTHYWHGEFEGSQERTLARRPGMMSVNAHKAFIKAFKTNGTPLTQYFC